MLYDCFMWKVMFHTFSKSQKITTVDKRLGMVIHACDPRGRLETELVEHLPRICEALGLTLST